MKEIVKSTDVRRYRRRSWRRQRPCSASRRTLWWPLWAPSCRSCRCRPRRSPWTSPPSPPDSAS